MTGNRTRQRTGQDMIGQGMTGQTIAQDRTEHRAGDRTEDRTGDRTRDRTEDRTRKDSRE